MLTSDASRIAVPTPMVPDTANDLSQRPRPAPSSSEQPALDVTALRELALLPAIPMVRLEAVRVLAMALLRTIESGSEGDPGKGVGLNLRDELQRFESNLIRSALACTGGRQRRAARLLGINVSTMNERIKRYKLNATERKAG